MSSPAPAEGTTVESAVVVAEEEEEERPAATRGGWRRWLTREKAKELFVGLALGQFVSILITSTSFTSASLANDGINAPTSQSFLNYALLAVVYGIWVIVRKQGLKNEWYYYIPLGFVDVEANYLVVKAYQYTSLTSVTLLDCWAIPCVVLLTWVFLKTKYSILKFVGVFICIGGLVTVVFSDVYSQGLHQGGPAPVKGDLFVIAGSTLYAVSNVLEEYLVKKGDDRVEVMAMLGLFGAIISAIQISILERVELRSIKWTTSAVLPFLGFALAMFLLYSTVPTILKICGSTMFNLSLLTSDMWAVVIQVAAIHQKVDWIYFLAFGGVAVGLLIYSLDPTKKKTQVDSLEMEEMGASNAEKNAVEGTEEGAGQQSGLPITVRTEES